MYLSQHRLHVGVIRMVNFIFISINRIIRFFRVKIKSMKVD